LATRIFMPFSSTLIFTRVGFFVFGSMGITLEAQSGASFSMIPPCWLRGFGFMCRLTRLIPSMMTLSSSRRIFLMRPDLPLYLPLMTTTVSPR